MKSKFYTQSWLMVFCLILLNFIFGTVSAQNAVKSTPIGIGRNCGGNNSTDSIRVATYDDVNRKISVGYKCKPSVGGTYNPGTGNITAPGFSSNSGSIAFNPKDQKVYYIATTSGNNSFVYNWTPNTCPSGLLPSNYYASQFVVGLDFEPSTGDGYQLEFTGSAAPYACQLRKVNFATNSFGASVPISLTAGAKIYKQNGDIIFTPAGLLYVAFDNKLFRIDYSNYASGTVIGNYVDSLRFTNASDYVTGISYAHGNFITSLQNSASSSTCSFKEIDITSGTAVVSNVTPVNNNFTALDMATLINGIGVAEKVSAVAPWTLGRWIVNYDIKIKNFGNSPLNNVQLVQDLSSVFGAAFTSATVSAVGTLPAGLALNSSYNGSTNTNIFVGGSSSILKASPTDSATIRIQMVLTNPNVTTTYLTTGLGSGTDALFGTNVIDSSNNDPALRADLNLDGVPDDSNEDIRTPLRISDWIFLANNVMDFNGAYKDKAVQLNWSMQNTEAGLTARLQRSTNGRDFSTIGNMDLKASTQVEFYASLDKSPSPADNYYRLEFQTATGHIFYSNVVVVSLKNIKPTELIVTPNPFRDQIIFSLNLERKDKVSYKLLDLHSRVISSGDRVGQAGDNKFTIDGLSGIPPGTYLLQTRVGEEQYHKMIIKTP